MVKIYSFYGSDKSLSDISSELNDYFKKNNFVGFTINSPEPPRNIEHYQFGLKLMDVSIDSDNEDIHGYVQNKSNIFTLDEETNLMDYTPWLDKLVKHEYFDNKVLSDTMIIFREHSLISVYNIFSLFRKMGLKPENAVYYSKGDRCRNISRIEASFKDKGYGVYTLSPFESISLTGKSEDEKITAEASARVHDELKSYFDKARDEKLKVIIFDDGGLLVTTVIDLFAKEYGDLIYGYIETTKGGMHAINSRSDLDVTVINLADSSVKNLLNAVIGHSIVQRLKEMIPNVGLRGQTTVVVGYGTLGRAISKDLRRLGMSVYICDTDDERIFEALTDGFPASKSAKSLIQKLRPILIMGCTGLDALTYDNLSLIQRDTYVATVSSNEIKQSYPMFDKNCELLFIDNYARIYTLPNKKKLYILGNGASLNLYNGEGANHSEYQPFLASMIETIVYSVINGPVKGKQGLDTEVANKILRSSNILGKYLDFSESLLD